MVVVEVAEDALAWGPKRGFRATASLVPDVFSVRRWRLGSGAEREGLAQQLQGSGATGREHDAVLVQGCVEVTKDGLSHVMYALRTVCAAGIVTVRVAVEVRGEVLEVRFEMALGV